MKNDYLHNIFWNYANLGVLPEDSDEMRLKKAVLTIISGGIAMLAIFWGTLYVASGYLLSGVIPLSYAVISFLSIAYFFKTRRFEFFRFSQLLLILLLPFLLQASLGGFANGSAVMVWGFFSPLAAMFFADNKSAFRWLLAFTALTILSGLLDETVSQMVAPIPKHINTLYFMINMGAGCVLIYIVLHYFVKDREHSHLLAIYAKEEAVTAKENLQDAYGRLQQQESKIRELMLTDPLTEIANRRYLDERIMTEMDRVSRYGQSLAVIMTDLDHFKKFNDVYGHLRGDEVLKTFARVIQDNLRATDFVARFGGEEFVILMPETSSDGACKLAERIRQSMQLQSIVGINEQVTASFGVTMMHEGDNPTQIFMRADSALYQSKEKGRNTVTFIE